MQENKLINTIGEVALTLPLFFIAVPTNTWHVLIISTILIIIMKRFYKYDFHFDDENQKWCLISSYVILIISMALYYMFMNYYITFMFLVLVSLGSAKLGYLYLHFIKFKEIKPYYDKLKTKYENVDFSKMTKEEIIEQCRENDISVKVANRLVKYYIDGLSYEEIADQECTSIEAIRNCFNRAKKIYKKRQ